MAYLIGLPLLVLAAVAQSAVVAHWRILNGGPDVVLLLTLSWTLAGDWRGGLVWAFVGGLCLDVLSTGPVGTATIGLVLMTYLASLTEGRFWRSHVLLPLAAVLLGSIGYHLFQLLLLSLSGYAFNVSVALTRMALPAVLLNTALMLPLYRIMRGLHALVYAPPVELQT